MTIGIRNQPSWVMSTPAPGALVPPAIAGAGYSLVLEDTFATLDTNYWVPIWYASGSAASPYGSTEPNPWPTGTVTSDGDILHMQATPATFYAKTSACTRRSTKAGSSAWQYGYFECRMNWPNIAGAWPAFWMLSLDYSFGPSTGLSPEIDVLEGSGAHPAEWTGHLHRNSNPNAGGDTINTNGFVATGSNMTGAYHKYALLWTATDLTWYLDDVQMATWPVFDTTNTLMFLIISNAISNSSHFFYDSANAISTSETQMIETTVDYVRVWQDSSGIRQ